LIKKGQKPKQQRTNNPTEKPSRAKSSETKVGSFIYLFIFKLAQASSIPLKNIHGLPVRCFFPDARHMVVAWQP